MTDGGDRCSPTGEGKPLFGGFQATFYLILVLLVVALLCSLTIRLPAGDVPAPGAEPLPV